MWDCAILIGATASLSDMISRKSIYTPYCRSLPWFSARYYCNTRCTGKHANFIFMQPIILDSPHKKFNWILNKNSTASEQKFLENKGTTVPLRIYPTYPACTVLLCLASSCFYSASSCLYSASSCFVLLLTA